jgi:hypothetical protein
MDNLRKAASDILKRKGFLVGRKEQDVSAEAHRVVEAMVEYLVEVQPPEMERLSDREKELSGEVSDLKKKVEELEIKLRHSENNVAGLMQEIGEKEVLASAFDKVRGLFESREWITQGRGPYAFDDEEYRKEVQYLLDDFNKIQEETWRNIRTKTFEYKQKLIKSYEGDLKEENRYLLNLIKKFQELCLKEHPILEEIIEFSKDVKTGHGIERYF